MDRDFNPSIINESLSFREFALIFQGRRPTYRTPSFPNARQEVPGPASLSSSSHYDLLALRRDLRTPENFSSEVDDLVPDQSPPRDMQQVPWSDTFRASRRRTENQDFVMSDVRNWDGRTVFPLRRRSQPVGHASPGVQSVSSTTSSTSSVIANVRNSAAASASGLSTTTGSPSMSRRLSFSLSSSNKNSNSLCVYNDDKKETATVEIKKDGKPEECCICQEILLTDLVALVPCGHVMHGECARQCVQHGRKCPQCRAKMNMRDPFVKLYLDVSSYANSSAADVLLKNQLKGIEKSLEVCQKDLATAEDKHKLLLKQSQEIINEKQRCAEQLREMHDKYSTNIKSEHKVRMEMKAMEDAYHVAVKEKQDAITTKIDLEKKIHHLEVALDNKDGEVNRLRKQLEEQTRRNHAMESLRAKRVSQDKLILEMGEKLRLQLEENNQLRARLADNHEDSSRRGFQARNHQPLRDFNAFRKRTYGDMNTAASRTDHSFPTTFGPDYFHDEDVAFEMTKRMSTPSSSSSSIVDSSTTKKLKLVPGTHKFASSILDTGSTKFKSSQPPRPGMQLTMTQMFSKRN